MLLQHVKCETFFKSQKLILVQFYMLLWAQFQGDEIYWSKLGSEFHKVYVHSVLYVVLFVMSPVTLVNTQNVSATKVVDSSSIQRAETKYDLRIQFLALVVMIHEVWLNA